MSDIWREDEITVGSRRVPNSELHIREGNPDAYQGSVHHFLLLAYEPATEESSATIRIKLGQGILVGMGAEEQHNIQVPLSEFVRAIRKLARKHDLPWQEFDRKRRERWVLEEAARNEAAKGAEGEK